MKLKTIDIFEFQDHREYLRRVVAPRQGSSGHIGVRRLAKKSGLKSPSTLSMIIQGTRGLTTRTAEQLAQGLSLTGRRRKYWMTFAQLSSAKTETERKRAQENLLRLRSCKSESSLEISQYEFLSTWYLPVIYVLAGVDDFSRDDQAIAGYLGRGVTPIQVASAFDILFRLGLLCVQDAKIIQAKGAISTREEIESLAIYKYHQQMIQMAGDALELPLDQREFSGLTVTIPASILPEVKAKIRNFRKEMNEYLSQFQSASEIYQLNLQLFPLTQGLSKLQSISRRESK